VGRGWFGWGEKKNKGKGTILLSPANTNNTKPGGVEKAGGGGKKRREVIGVKPNPRFPPIPRKKKKKKRGKKTR